MFLRQVILQNGIPFEVKYPEDTLEFKPEVTAASQAVYGIPCILYNFRLTDGPYVLHPAFLQLPPIRIYQDLFYKEKVKEGNYMAATTPTQIRIEENTKKQAVELLEGLGLNLSDAVNRHSLYPL